MSTWKRRSINLSTMTRAAQLSIRQGASPQYSTDLYSLGTLLEVHHQQGQGSCSETASPHNQVLRQQSLREGHHNDAAQSSTHKWSLYLSATRSKVVLHQCMCDIHVHVHVDDIECHLTCMYICSDVPYLLEYTPPPPFCIVVRRKRRGGHLIEFCTYAPSLRPPPPPPSNASR